MTQRIFFLLIVLLMYSKFCVSQTTENEIIINPENSTHLDSSTHTSNEELQDGVIDYDDSSYQAVPDTPKLRVVNQETWQHFRNDAAFAYANDSSYWDKKKANQQKGVYTDALILKLLEYTVILFKYIIIPLIVLLVAYMLYKGGGNWVFFTRKKSRQTVAEYDDLLIHSSDFAALRANAIAQQDYRLAIRYGYLHYLQLLKNNGLINYHPKTTNAGYSAQLQSSYLYKDFKELVTIYEYCWYGHFQISEAQYMKANTILETLREKIV
jgi:hypothetical protein